MIVIDIISEKNLNISKRVLISDFVYLHPWYKENWRKQTNGSLITRLCYLVGMIRQQCLRFDSAEYKWWENLDLKKWSEKYSSLHQLIQDYLSKLGWDSQSQGINTSVGETYPSEKIFSFFFLISTRNARGRKTALGQGVRWRYHSHTYTPTYTQRRIQNIHV